MPKKTDTELIVIAALAAGLRVEATGNNVYVSGKGRMNAVWNPLANLYDAFELASFTGVNVDFEDSMAIYAGRDVWVYSDDDSLPRALKTCRAIVLAVVEQYEERKAFEECNPPSEYD